MKKNLTIIICTAIIVVALGVMLFFVFTGDTDGAEEKTMDMTGTWRVLCDTAESSVLIVENEYVVFAEGEASCYRDGQKIASSTYTISDALLELPEISRQYVLKAITGNLASMSSSQTEHKYVVRVPDGNMDPEYSVVVDITGKWDVKCHSNQAVVGEVLAFGDDVAEVYRNDEVEPSSTAEYFWNEEGRLIIDAWLKDVVAYRVTDEIVVLVEVDTGFLWELHRITD